MRRSLSLVVGGIGAVGAALFLRGRRAALRPEADPAEELRRRLATARSGAEPLPPEREPPTAPLPTPDPGPVSTAEPRPEPPELGRDDVESRRAEVHARARARVDEMRGEPPAEP